MQSTISVLKILTDGYRANITKHNRYGKIYLTPMQTCHRGVRWCKQVDWSRSRKKKVLSISTKVRHQYGIRYLQYTHRFKRQYQNRKHCQLTFVRQIVLCILVMYKY